MKKLRGGGAGLRFLDDARGDAAAAGVAHELDLDVGIAFVEGGGDLEDRLRRRALVPDHRSLFPGDGGEILHRIGARRGSRDHERGCDCRPDQRVHRKTHRVLPRPGCSARPYDEALAARA
jgi:hypothetical protein